MMKILSNTGKEKKRTPLAAKKRGFTLIEMIVVVVIIAIIYSFAAPTLNRYNVRKKLQFDADKVQHVIEMARSTATTERNRIEVVFDSAANACFYQVEGASNYLDKIQKLDTSVSFASAPASIIFKASGGLTASADQTITLRGAGSKTIDILVNARTGRVEAGAMS